MNPRFYNPLLFLFEHMFEKLFPGHVEEPLIEDTFSKRVYFRELIKRNTKQRLTFPFPFVHHQSHVYQHLAKEL